MQELLKRLKTFSGFTKEECFSDTDVERVQETIDRLLNPKEMKKRGSLKMTLDEKYNSAIAYLIRLHRGMDDFEIENKVTELSEILKYAHHSK